MSEDLRVDDEAVPPDDAGSAEETEAAGQVAFFDRADGSLAFDVLDLPGVSGPPSREPPPEMT